MGRINDGGPAFPAEHSKLCLGESGLTKLDYYTAAALQGLLACPLVAELHDDGQQIARHAVRMAIEVLVVSGKYRPSASEKHETGADSLIAALAPDDVEKLVRWTDGGHISVVFEPDGFEAEEARRWQALSSDRHFLVVAPRQAPAARGDEEGVQP